MEAVTVKNIYHYLSLFGDINMIINCLICHLECEKTGVRLFR